MDINMRVLHIEDDAIKHTKIRRVLTSCDAKEISWAKNLEDGITLLKEAKSDGKAYQLIITDMYYPLETGGEEVEAGEIFIQKMKEMQDDTPVILCSSVNYKYPELFGSLYYSEESGWEEKLKSLLKVLKEKK